jgi:RING-H2 zinc finger domain
MHKCVIGAQKLSTLCANNEASGFDGLVRYCNETWPIPNGVDSIRCRQIAGTSALVTMLSQTCSKLVSNLFNPLLIIERRDVFFLDDAHVLNVDDMGRLFQLLVKNNRLDLLTDIGICAWDIVRCGVEFNNIVVAVPNIVNFSRFVADGTYGDGSHKVEVLLDDHLIRGHNILRYVVSVNEFTRLSKKIKESALLQAFSSCQYVKQFADVLDLVTTHVEFMDLSSVRKCIGRHAVRVIYDVTIYNSTAKQAFAQSVLSSRYMEKCGFASAEVARDVFRSLLIRPKLVFNDSKAYVLIMSALQAIWPDDEIIAGAVCAGNVLFACQSRNLALLPPRDDVKGAHVEGCCLGILIRGGASDEFVVNAVSALGLHPEKSCFIVPHVGAAEVRRISKIFRVTLSDALAAAVDAKIDPEVVQAFEAEFFVDPRFAILANEDAQFRANIEAEFLEFFNSTFKADADFIDDICAICQSAFVQTWGPLHGTIVSDGTWLARIPCGHVFHANCMQTFLTSNSSYSNQCPLCRSNIDDGGVVIAGVLPGQRTDTNPTKVSIADYFDRLFLGTVSK